MMDITNEVAAPPAVEPAGAELFSGVELALLAVLMLTMAGALGAVLVQVL